jgi:XTP/dITP diphosphohydrolase
MAAVMTDNALMTPPSLLLATTNYDKVAEIRDILGDIPIELVTLTAWPSVDAPEETGVTFAENARAKALYYAVATGMTVVAEDSGLEIDVLDGAPGVHSARFGGVDSSYPEKFLLIEAALGERGAETSSARYVCTLAVANGNQVLFEARGTIEGQITKPPRGSGGFGYDPIFYYPPFGCTLAEAPGRKASVSHRGKAFRELRNYLLGLGVGG